MRFLKSMQFAMRGMRFAFWEESNFRIQTAAALISIGAGFFFRISHTEWIIILCLITAVLVLELLNTAIERMSDVIKPRLHQQVAVIKDITAAMVLLTALLSLIVGSIIFVPYIVEFLALNGYTI